VIELLKGDGHDVDHKTHDYQGRHLETKDKLKLDKSGGHANIISNAVAILETDPLYKSLWFNDNICITMYKGKQLSDKVVMDIRLDIERRYDVSLGYDELARCLMTVAMERVVDPVKEYLESLTWDKKEERLKTLLEVVFKAKTDEYSSGIIQTISVKYFVSCVARRYDPGCKVDSYLTLSGPKATGKSSSLKILAGKKWFADAYLNVSSPRDAGEMLHQSGAWLYEIAELHSFKGKSSGAVKGFLTRTTDLYRPAYGKMMQNRDRKTVFFCTTNDMQFMIDGPDRRFCPIEVTEMIDLEYLKENRDQIWAEAVHLYKQGVDWMLNAEERAQLSYYQRGFIINDPWSMRIESFLRENEGEKVTTQILAEVALELKPRELGRKTSDRICKICRELGYTRINGKPSYWGKE